jgi:serine/threonine-protein kinase
MSDSASSTKAAQQVPPAAGAGRPAGDGAAGAPPNHDDQPTVITNRSPMVPEAISDSALRILQGRILPGDRLGHFELVQYVGGGGMGRVFQARDTRLARSVAIKVLPVEQAADREVVRRFQNEAQSAARLDHDNIARVHYVGEDRGLHYIVFEFIEGVNVRELVASKGPLPLGEAVSYTFQVAEALEHAAARNVVHRDIKPSNVLITPQGQVKLIDMGLARLRETDPVAAELTASGVTLGTFDYISPEQARDPHNADVRSDIYSLGCTFFFMLTGHPPFPGGTVLQKLLQHQGDQPPDVRQFRPELPEDVTRVLRKMLAKEPRQRYRDPADLVGDLAVIAQGVGLQRTGAGGRTWSLPRQPPPPFLRRHSPWLVPLAALLAIVVTLDFVWSRRSGDAAGPPEYLTAVGPPGAIDVSAGTRDPEGLPGDEPSLKPSAGVAPKPSGVTPTPPAGVAQKPAAGAAPAPSPGVAAKPSPGGPQPPPAGVPQSPAAGVAQKPAAGGPQPPAAKPGLLLADSSRPAGGPKEPAAGPAVPGESAAPGKRAGVLRVAPAAHGDSEFTTLEAACNAASNGDVIELCYNGPREEQPLKLANLRVRVRAGEGYQPVVVFRPTQTDPLKCPRSMLTVSAGRLTLLGVAVEMVLPRHVPADGWSLFEIRGSPSVRLNKCTLSIRNASEQMGAYHQEVAFFRVRPAKDDDRANDDATAAPLESAVIDLIDCVVRGEATLLRAEGEQPACLTWDNGLLAITERVLWASGGARMPRPGEVLQFDLRHLTAVVRGGFARLADSPVGPHQLTTRIDCADTILSAAPGSPIIEQVGGDELESFRERVAWNGDRNVYDGFGPFWLVRRLDADGPPDAMTFDAWKSHWGPEHENLPQALHVDWKQPPAADRPMDSHTVADYALGDEPGNPALGTASDGRDAGCLAERLPAVAPAAAGEGRPAEKPARPEPPAAAPGTEPVRLPMPPTSPAPSPQGPSPAPPPPMPPALQSPMPPAPSSPLPISSPLLPSPSPLPDSPPPRPSDSDAPMR